MNIQLFKLEQFDVAEARKKFELQFVAGVRAPFAGPHLLNFELIFL